MVRPMSSYIKDRDLRKIQTSRRSTVLKHYWSPIIWVSWWTFCLQMGVPLSIMYCKLHLRLTPFPQRSCKYFRLEHITPNKLAWGIVNNEINDFMIPESFSFGTILCFTPTSYSNITTPQSHATVVKL
jgi:hypothetical protein